MTIDQYIPHQVATVRLVVLNPDGSIRHVIEVNTATGEAKIVEAKP
jgi:hypothetical protein